MTTIMKASHQWATRPDDQRFTSLDELVAHAHQMREISKAPVIPSRRVEAAGFVDRYAAECRVLNPALLGVE